MTTADREKKLRLCEPREPLLIRLRPLPEDPQGIYLRKNGWTFSGSGSYGSARKKKKGGGQKGPRGPGALGESWGARGAGSERCFDHLTCGLRITTECHYGPTTLPLRHSDSLAFLFGCAAARPRPYLSSIIRKKERSTLSVHIKLYKH